MRARLTKRANREALSAFDWILRDNQASARAFRHAVIDAAMLIGDQPFAGTERPELVDPPLRLWPLHRFSYVMVYDPSHSPPQILRIVHGARDLPQVLADLRAD